VSEPAHEAKTIGDYRIFDELKRHFKLPLLPIATRGYVPHRKTMINGRVNEIKSY
jgi:hypothetical protein